MFKQTRSYKESLYKQLRDNEEASEYLRVALEDGVSAFLVALRNVAESRQIASVAEAASLNRENLYRALSADGNPKLASLAKILHSLGLKLDVAVEEPSAPEAPVVRVKPCKVLPWKPKTTFAYASKRNAKVVEFFYGEHVSWRASHDNDRQTITDFDSRLREMTA